LFSRVLVCGGKVWFRVYGDVWVITLVGKEWGYSSGGVGSIVVRELHDRQEFRPFVLLVVTKHSEILFKHLISLFCLFITFGVVSGGKVEFHVWCFSK